MSTNQTPAVEAKYQVWFEPTENGKAAFGWKDELYGGEEPMTLEEAQHEAYLAGLDDPAPDKREYGRYVVREIKP